MQSAHAVEPTAVALTGPEKVAILCLALGPEHAGMLTRQLSPGEVELVSQQMARTDRVPGAVADAVLTEWLETAWTPESLVEEGVEYVRAVLEQAFGGPRAAQILKHVLPAGDEQAGLGRLQNADPQQLATRVRGEHPQTIALILAHLSPAHTASVLRHLDARLGSDVVYRMARMEKVSPDMLQVIERTLSAETDLALGEGMRASGGPEVVAEVLNRVPQSLEQELLQELARRDRALCEEIRNLMFVFEDIVRLDDRAVERLLREVDTKELALALKAASGELKDRILAAMTQRAVDTLLEEMEYLGPVRLREVEAAQQRIVRQARMLEEAGEIVINTGANDLVIG